LGLLLGQRDRDVATEGLALPLVAGGATELDVEDECLRLAGLDDSEVEARGQVGHRGERDLSAGRADSDTELVVVERRVGGGRVGETGADAGDGGDRSVVLDVERLSDDLAGSQVVEVEIDRTDGVVVADAEDDGRRVDVDACALGVREQRSRSGDARDRNECDESDSENAGDLGSGAET